MGVRELAVAEITRAVRDLCIEANYYLGEDVRAALERALALEEAPLGKEILRQLLANADLAARERLPICQDTGMAVVFLEIGQDVHLSGGELEAAVQEGVRQGYREGYLRKSVVADPLERVNTGDNTPAVCHCELVPGDRVRVTVAPKGFGSENMSALVMLPPAAGRDGVKRFIVETVARAGANPCPPLVVGVGLGGTFEAAALLAKKALLRPVGTAHPRPELAALEAELLEEINALGIGPQGLGGRVTALGVAVESMATHIAGLPVAVNLCCHVLRRRERVL